MNDTGGAPERGKGFIISGDNVTLENKKAYLPDIDFNDIISPLKDSAFCAAKNVSVALDSSSKEVSSINRRFLLKTASFCAAIAAVTIFFHYFTFGIGVFKDKKYVLSTENMEEYSELIKSASSMAEELGGENIRLEYSAYPVIVLKKSSLKSDSSASKLLLALPEFRRAYTLVSDGSAIYNAKTKEEAENVLNEFINKYSVNGNAHASQDVEIKEKIVKKDSISSKKECAELLESSGLVTVMSVSDSSYDVEIPFDTKTNADSSLYIGESVTVSEGSTGTARVLQETVYKNGVKESVSVLSKSVTAEPVSRVVNVGTKEKEVLKSGLKWPLKGTLSSPFGERWGRIHQGIDIAVSVGTPVKAAECGTVEYVSENAGGYGKYVRIDHGYGVKTAYGHLSRIDVKEGQTVTCDDTLALSGNTGNSTGPHLHFEIIRDGEKINPIPYLKD